MSDFSDFSLGNRFWFTSHVDAFNAIADQALHLEHHDAVQSPDAGNIHDNTITNFLEHGDNASVRTAINRAELFAAEHILTEDLAEQERRLSANNARLLGIDQTAFAAELVTVTEELDRQNGPGERLDGNALRPFFQIALQKLLASKDFTERAMRGDPLGETGKAALRNATLGLAELLRRGTVSPNAVIALADSNFYDLSNSAEVLKLVTNSARIVQEKFLDVDKLDATLRDCQAALRDLPPETPSRIRESLEQKLLILQSTGQRMLRNRREATEGLVTDFHLSDPTGKVKSDRAFQTKQLDLVRNRLRAFRYDLDLLTGKQMGVMERFRRKLDSLHPFSSPEEPHITEGQFRQLRQDTTDFNLALRVFQESLRNVQPAQNGVVAQPPLNREPLSLEAAIADATDFSHTTNDSIRYYFSGTKGKEAALSQEVHEKLDQLAQNGGTRKATLEVGLDFMVNLDPSFAKMNLRAGAKFKVEAEVSASTGGGKLSVTYRYGGAAYAKTHAEVGKGRSILTAQHGFNPNAINSGEGFGASIQGGAEAGLTRKTTRTYGSVDQFILDTKGESLAMQDSLFSLIFSGIGKGIKKVGHLFTLGTTALGFRIHKTKMDNVAYVAKLRATKVLTNLDTVMLAKKNAVVLSKRTTVDFQGGLNGDMQGGFYSKSGSAMGIDQYSKDFGIHGGFSLSHSREFHVRNQSYTLFGKAIQSYSLPRLQTLLQTEADAQQGLEEFRETREELRALSRATTRQEISEGFVGIMRRVEEMEATGTTHPATDKDFWSAFAKCARFATIVCAILTRKAEALPQEDRDVLAPAIKAAKEYLPQRICNPTVELPKDVFQEELMRTDNLGDPARKTSQGSLTLGVSWGNVLPTVDSGKDDSDSMLSKVGDVIEGKRSLESILGGGPSFQDMRVSAANGMIDIAERKVLNNKLDVTGEVVYNSLIDAPKDTRPWKNSSVLTVNVELTENMPLRALIDYVSQAVATKLGGGEKQDVNLYNQLKEELTFEMGLLAISCGFELTGPLMLEGIGKLVVKSEGFRKFLLKLGGIGLDAFQKVAQGQLSLDAGYTYNIFKTMSFRFEGRRFACFSQGTTVATNTHLGFNLFGPGANISLKTRTNAVDEYVFPRPSIDTMLARAEELSALEDPQVFQKFLEHNQKGVLRLLRAFSQIPEDKNATPDGNFQVDRQQCQERLTSAMTFLGEMLQQEDLQDDAKELKASMDTLLPQLLDPDPNQSVNERLDTGRKFFATMAKVFKLANFLPEAQ